MCVGVIQNYDESNHEWSDLEWMASSESASSWLRSGAGDMEKLRTRIENCSSRCRSSSASNPRRSSGSRGRSERSTREETLVYPCGTMANAGKPGPRGDTHDDHVTRRVSEMRRLTTSRPGTRP